jgi:hypothetical protein
MRVTDEPKKPLRKKTAAKPSDKPKTKAPPKPRAKSRGKSKALGGPGGGSLTPRLWIAARAMYESDKTTTYQSIADEFGLSRTTVDRRAREEQWTKKVDSLAKMSERAHHIADNAKAALEEAGPDLTPDKIAEVQTVVTVETGAEVRAKILERHRQEWAAPRKIAYEAIKKGNEGSIAAAFEQAKLAKITSEVLRNVQDGERKAWGMDRGELGEKVTVVIERE